MFCKNCGAPLTPEKRFCSRCGTAVEAETPVTLEAKVDLTPNPTPDTPNTQPTACVQQAATNPAQAAPNTQPTTDVQQAATNPAQAAPNTQPMAGVQQAATNPAQAAPNTQYTQNAQFAQNPQAPPQMTWQEWQSWQNWQNAQNTKSSVNLSDGIQRMQESDSFVFRSLGLTLKTLFSKPILLWGLSLLGVILKFCANILCSIPAIFGLSVSETLSAGMDCVFLDAYNGKNVNSKQIFAGFSSGKSFFRVAGGMLWKSLWLIIWGLLLIIPPVGIGVLIYKGLSYSFTPYILLKKQDLSPLDALKRSMQLTKGYKGKIFVTYLLVAAAFLLIALISFLFGLIPYVGPVITVLISIVVAVLSPLFFGVLRAAMFTEVLRLEKVEDIEL
ncbi:MAG: zinc-ribbon domain-containing protein [Oscillospiraceae bacterium]|nr:zinc-ribbon domain-containing protein [Oscillospiraceae bacterium]